MIKYSGLRPLLKGKTLYIEDAIEVRMNKRDLEELISIVKSKAVNERREYDRIANYVSIVQSLESVKEQAQDRFDSDKKLKWKAL